jgi:hypothetical protein
VIREKENEVIPIIGEWYWVRYFDGFATVKQYLKEGFVFDSNEGTKVKIVQHIERP